MATPDKRANLREGYHQFATEDGEKYGSFEVFWMEEDRRVMVGPVGSDSMGPVEEGWYWAACFPGCLLDGDPSGPFTTSTEAFWAAREV